MSRRLPPIATVVSFIDRVNHGDLEGLVSLMTNEHELRVLDEPPVEGCEANRRAWRGCMASFPRYVILPQRIAADGSRVAVLGSTIGSHLGLPDDEEQRISVVWVAEERDGKLASWAILDDAPETRTKLGLA